MLSKKNKWISVDFDLSEAADCSGWFKKQLKRKKILDSDRQLATSLCFPKSHILHLHLEFTKDPVIHNLGYSQ
jgi:hypothetical protein